LNSTAILNTGVEAGTYFKDRLQQATLTNLQFFGESIPQRNFAVVKFVITVGQFKNLQYLELKSLANAPLIFQAFTQMKTLQFALSLKHLHINACILKEMNAD
jgi:hypothetical protein